MYTKISNGILAFSEQAISADRKLYLQPLIEYLTVLLEEKKNINLNFICTHNSRRSHLSHVWAQTMADYFDLPLSCYSGGTEATAMFVKIADTLTAHGFLVTSLSHGINPIYMVKHSPAARPIVCFSKVYDHEYNPNQYAAVMVCNHADENCPVVAGQEARFAIPFEDPKAYDGTEVADEMYHRTSLDIGQELWYVMHEVSKKNSRH